jgi:nitrite reductase/ring-hydroxylating ferredoxin subunit
VIATSTTSETTVLTASRRSEPAVPRPTVAKALRTAAAGSVTAVDDGVRSAALVVLADRRAFVVDDRCPHDGGLLSDGFLDGERLVCARHGWEFDPCTGTCPWQSVAVGTRRVR